jgi:hypothetical protein
MPKVHALSGSLSDSDGQSNRSPGFKRIRIDKIDKTDKIRTTASSSDFFGNELIIQGSMG